jgi:DNA-binding winged helix-turn-helix (wHTH) protein/tetratricopeptide (TPR) repeat protein
MLYRFGDYQVDVQARRVDRCGEPVALEPRPFDLLVHLIRQRRRVVPKEELREQLWQKARGSDAALSRAVMKLRRAVTTPDGAEVIRTVARAGYRFVAPLSSGADCPADGPADNAAVAAADGRAIALLPVENATGDASLAWLELGLMALAVRELEDRPGVMPAAIPSVMASLQGAGAAGGTSGHASGHTSVDAAVRRATGAAIVVHSRIVRGRGAELQLNYTARGSAAFKGSVASDRPTDLAARFADALMQALHPSAGAPPPRPQHDPLADECLARGLQAMTVHRWSKAANLLRLALDLEPDRIDAQLGLLRALANVGDNSMLPLAQRLLEHAQSEQNTMLAARVQLTLGLLHLRRSDLAQADHHLELALEGAAGKGDAHWTAGTLMLQAATAINRLDHARARQVIARMYEQCELSGDRIVPVSGLGLEVHAIASGGDLEQAVALSIESARRARELRLHGYLVASCDNTAVYLAKLGRLAEAAVHSEESAAAALAVENWADAWRSMPTLCWIYRLARAPEAARQALGRMPDPADLASPEHAWRARGLLAAAEGRHADAADDLLPAVRRHRQLQHGYNEGQTLPWLIDALVLSGRLAEAEAELAAAAAPHLSGSADLQFQMLHAQALLAHAQGRAEQAMACLTQLADSAAAPLWRAWACIDLAWLQAEAGRLDAASRTLDRVPPVLADHPLMRAARARLRATGAHCAPVQHLPTRR